VTILRQVDRELARYFLVDPSRRQVDPHELDNISLHNIHVSLYHSAQQSSTPAV